MEPVAALDLVVGVVIWTNSTIS